MTDLFTSSFLRHVQEALEARTKKTGTVDGQQAAASASLLEPVTRQMQSIMERISSGPPSGVTTIVSSSVITTHNASSLRIVNGIFSRLSAEYKVPSYPVSAHWDLWHFGIPDKRIVAHKFVDIRHDIKGQANKPNFCRIKCPFVLSSCRPIKGLVSVSPKHPALLWWRCINKNNAKSTFCIAMRFFNHIMSFQRYLFYFCSKIK